MVLHDDFPDPPATPMSMSCDDQHLFSFTPHASCSRECTTSSYPSPPPTNSPPKAVPLPGPSTYGGLLDSPVVPIGSTTTAPLSPPPTLPTLTLDLPDDVYSCSQEPSALIAEERTPSPRQSQLLSPISPEWPSSRKTEDALFDDSSESVLLAQPFGRDYASSFGDSDAPRGAAHPSLSPLDIDEAVAPLDLQALIEDEPIPSRAFSEDILPLSPTSSQATLFSSTDLFPPSPAPSWRKLDNSEPVLDGLGLGIVSESPSWLYSPSLPSLVSFASLPSPELDDLDLDMDLGPGLGMSASPSRRSVASLPLFDESEYELECVSPQDEVMVAANEGSMSPPHSPPPSLTPMAPANALFLELPPEPAAPKPASLLDAYTPDELASRLPPHFSQTELHTLLDVRARAHATLAECAAAPPASCGWTMLDHELRKSVPRDAGEPRRRRKRAKELGREADALIGFAVGLLPDPTSASVPDKDKRVADDARASVRRDKAGLAGLTSLPQLVARMILRRRDRCVRGLEGGASQPRMWKDSPLRQSVSDDNEPSKTEVEEHEAA